jgi:hypothetical protein
MNPPFVKKQCKCREKGEPHVNIENENKKVIVNTKNTKTESVDKFDFVNTLENGKIKSQR